MTIHDDETHALPPEFRRRIQVSLEETQAALDEAQMEREHQLILNLERQARNRRNLGYFLIALINYVSGLLTGAWLYKIFLHSH